MPGWLTAGSFVLGLVESFLYGAYAGLVFTPIDNFLAGGEGSRLRPLTAAIAGDERPKRFCALLGTETLLERTRFATGFWRCTRTRLCRVARP